jgi:hypothetical protein
MARVSSNITGDNQDAIDDLDAITGGQAPSEAEHNALVTAINSILAALREAGVIKS